MNNDRPAKTSDEVLEVDATDEVAAIYADIRETMAMPFVNLIWRRLALSPEGLRWTWDTMKPLYSDGAVYSEAALLRDGQDLLPVPQLPAAALRAVGVDAQAEVSIRAALAGYDRGNPLNLVAFSAVLTRLRKGGDPAPGAGNADGPVPDPARVDAMRKATPPAPRMLSFEEMDETTAELVRAVNLIGARDAARQVRVSLPRNLAHWPGFLSLYLATLQPLHDDGRLFFAIDAVLADGEARGARLASRLGNTGLPPESVTASVREPIESLVPHAMGRMISVVSLLQRILPG